MTHGTLITIISWMNSWMMKQPLVGVLLFMMTLDVVSGLLLAFSSKKLCSTVSWRGMSRKVIMLLLVGVGSILEPFANELPLSKLIAMFYITTEAISILENAAKAGVPLPRPLVDALVKLSSTEGTEKLPESLTVSLSVDQSKPLTGAAETHTTATTTASTTTTQKLKP